MNKNQYRGMTRRAVLGGMGTVGVSGFVGGATANPGNGYGFPPRGRTDYSDPEQLGDGEVKAFLADHPQDKWTYLGVEMTAEAATIDETEYPDRDLVSIEFPGDTQFEWLGLNWEPAGHGPPDVYGVPHFDIHFYLEPEDVINQIEPVNYPPGTGDPYAVELADDQFPPGYFRTRAVVANMGEHLFDATSHEWEAPGVPSGEQFTETFVWGHYDGDVNFFEPMITTEFFAGLEGTVTAPISMPERMPEAGEYPTEYRIAYHKNRDAYTVTLAAFESFEESEG